MVTNLRQALKLPYPRTQLGLIRETCAAMLVQTGLVSGPGDPGLIETRRNRWIESINSAPWQPLHTNALHYPLIVAGLLPQSAGAVRTGGPCTDGITSSWSSGSCFEQVSWINQRFMFLHGS